MKSAATLLLLLLPIRLFAAMDPDSLRTTFERQNTCESFVTVQEESLVMGSSSRSVKLLKADDEREFVTDAYPLGAALINGRLWILTTEALEEWNTESITRLGTYPTYKAERSMQTWEHPTSLAVYKNSLVISHGIWGFSIFDPATKAVTSQALLNGFQQPKLSMATGVSVIGNQAYFTMDDVTMVQPGEKPAFRGIIKVDLSNPQIAKPLPGLDAGADAIATDGQKLVVSFMGLPLWSYSSDRLNSKSLPTPDARVWKFGREGHPFGRAWMDSKYYYSCFRARPPHGGRYLSVPVALERAAIKL